MTSTFYSDPIDYMKTHFGPGHDETSLISPLIRHSLESYVVDMDLSANKIVFETPSDIKLPDGWDTKALKFNVLLTNDQAKELGLQNIRLGDKYLISWPDPPHPQEIPTYKLPISNIGFKSLAHHQDKEARLGPHPNHYKVPEDNLNCNYRDIGTLHHSLMRGALHYDTATVHDFGKLFFNKELEDLADIDLNDFPDAVDTMMAWHYGAYKNIRPDDKHLPSGRFMLQKFSFDSLTLSNDKGWQIFLRPNEQFEGALINLTLNKSDGQALYNIVPQKGDQIEILSSKPITQNNSYAPCFNQNTTCLRLIPNNGEKPIRSLHRTPEKEHNPPSLGLQVKP